MEIFEKWWKLAFPADIVFDGGYKAEWKKRFETYGMDAVGFMDGKRLAALIQVLTELKEEAKQ
jgi:hypothetical protein